MSDGDRFHNGASHHGDQSLPRSSVKNSFNPTSSIIANSLQETIFGSKGYGGSGLGEQLSQVESLFKNLRWNNVTNLRQLLSELYSEFGIVRTVVDIPVEDGMGDKIEIKTKLFDSDELEDLVNTIEAKQDFETVAQALKWMRLFGGAGIIIMHGEPEDLEKPFSMDDVSKGDQIEFKAVDLWELYWMNVNTDDPTKVIMDPADIYHSEFYNYYNFRIHRTRVIKFEGDRAPSFIRPRLRGWGMSVVETLIRPINQYLKATNLSFECLDEFKVDVYRFKDLASMAITPDGQEAIMRRVMLANQQKNFHQAIVMDWEDAYEQKKMNFQGLGTVFQENRTQLASSIPMPQTKLFGHSPTGMNAGAHDIENYNRMVVSKIRTKAKSPLLKVIKLRCLCEFGNIPEDLGLEFESLRVMTEEQEEQVKTARFARLLEARQSGEISSKDFKESCNVSDLLPMKLKVTDETWPIEPPPGEPGGFGQPGPGPGAPMAKPKAPAQRPTGQPTVTKPKEAKKSMNNLNISGITFKRRAIKFKRLKRGQNG